MKNNILLEEYISAFYTYFAGVGDHEPWHLVKIIQDLLNEKMSQLNADYTIAGNLAIHKNATVEDGVILKGPIIVSEGVFIGAHAYLRGGVFLAPNVSVGPGCEIKSSFIMEGAALAHFNFVGDSIVGTGVNMEAGSIIANHHNDRDDKSISVRIGNTVIATGATKFGAIVGDHSKVGANAVLSPGTILPRNSIVARLQLINQLDSME